MDKSTVSLRNLRNSAFYVRNQQEASPESA